MPPRRFSRAYDPNTCPENVYEVTHVFCFLRGRVGENIAEPVEKVIGLGVLQYEEQWESSQTIGDVLLYEETWEALPTMDTLEYNEGWEPKPTVDTLEYEEDWEPFEVVLHFEDWEFVIPTEIIIIEETWET